MEHKKTMLDYIADCPEFIPTELLLESPLRTSGAS
jgi:hypothetical protein